MDWVTTNFSQDMGKYVEDVFANADTLFLGEVTYKIMAAYWPTADTNPEAFQGDAEGAQNMNSIRKVVFSKNLKILLEQLHAQNRDSSRRDQKNEAGIWQEHTGRRKCEHRTATDKFLAWLMNTTCSFTPIILGNGKPLFKAVRERHTLKLISTEVFKNGVVLLRYEPLR